MIKKLLYILTLILLILLWSCTSTHTEKKILIALSKGKGSKHYIRYGEWLEENNPNVKCVDLYYVNSIEEIDNIMSEASGLVLTGGPDVHPGRYGQEFDTARCEIDPKRDTLEFYLIEQAKLRGMPILGICRGLQILNVAYGGTLFVDIPSDYGTKVIHRCDSIYCYHYVTIDTVSLLYSIMKEKRLKVNSYHHQGINKMADAFIVNARSDDGLIEGIEFKKKYDNPFLLAVQWHPERLNSQTSMKLARHFIRECFNFNNLKIIKK